MSKCEIVLNLPGTGGGLISQLSAALNSAGGELDGNEQAGSFELATPLGKVKGRYTITGQILSIEVLQKPLFLSCGKIESELVKRLSDFLAG